MKERRVEIRAMRSATVKRIQRIKEAREIRDDEALEMREVDNRNGRKEIHPRGQKDNIILGDTLEIPAGGKMKAINEDNPEEDRRLLRTIKEGYNSDTLTRSVLANPENHKRHFRLAEGLLWTRNFQDKEVICVPRYKDLITRILTKAHEIVGHYGDQRTCEYVRRWYWWPQMTKMTANFCKTCEACQRAKGPNQRPTGKLHTLPVPIKPWDSIGMDFVGPFPESRGFNYLWVVICRMTSMVHLIPVTVTVTATELSWVYRREVVRLHGLPSSIVSDRDSKFTSRWWKELHRLLGAKLLMSTSYHPQTDGQTERAIRNVVQIIWTVVDPSQKDWIDRVDMTEFAINASISESTGYAPFELNGGFMPSMIKEIRSDESFARGVKSFAETALKNMADAHDAII